MHALLPLMISELGYEGTPAKFDDFGSVFRRQFVEKSPTDANKLAPLADAVSFSAIGRLRRLSEFVVFH